MDVNWFKMVRIKFWMIIDVIIIPFLQENSHDIVPPTTLMPATAEIQVMLQTLSNPFCLNPIFTELKISLPSSTKSNQDRY